MDTLTLIPGTLTLQQLRTVFRQHVSLSLDGSAKAAIQA